MASTLKVPSLARSAGINRAPGTNKDRNRSQSRFLVGGPEITSYVAAMIASGEETSAGLASGALASGVAGAAAVLCDFAASCADTAETKHPKRPAILTTRSTRDMKSSRAKLLCHQAAIGRHILNPARAGFPKNPHENAAPEQTPARAPGCTPDYLRAVSRMTPKARANHAPYKIPCKSSPVPSSTPHL